MFPNFAELHEQISCAGRKAGETASSYAERIIARLDRIADAVQSEDFEEDYFIYKASLSATIPLPGETVASVPLGEEWFFQGGWFNAQGGSSDLAIMLDDWHIAGGRAPGANSPFGGPIAGQDFVIPGGSIITIRYTANANPNPSLILLAFKKKRKKPTPKAKAAGHFVHHPDGTDPRQDPSEEGRHGNPTAALNGSR